MSNLLTAKPRPQMALAERMTGIDPRPLSQAYDSSTLFNALIVPSNVPPSLTRSARRKTSKAYYAKPNNRIHSPLATRFNADMVLRNRKRKMSHAELSTANARLLLK